MKYFKLILLTLFSIPTYGQITTDSIFNSWHPSLYDSSKVAYYNEQMRKKNFTFYQTSTNIFEPTHNQYVYERGIPYIYNLDISDSLITVQFRVIDACSQYHLGDYKIKKGTIIFEYETVTGMSFCLSWYNYILKIPNTTKGINHVIIRDKQYKHWWKKTTSKDSRFYYKSTDKIEIY